MWFISGYTIGKSQGLKHFPVLGSLVYLADDTRQQDKGGREHRLKGEKAI